MEKWTQEELDEYLDKCERLGILANFSGKNLTGLNFNGSNLSCYNFSSANLNNCSFINCKLINVNFTRANLTDANLSIADMTDANLIGATLANANLTSAVLERGKLAYVNFTSADLTEACLVDCKFRGADFTNAILIDTNFNMRDKLWPTYLNLSNVSFRCANLTGNNLRGINFTNVDFSGAKFTDVNVAGVSFRGCNFNNTKITVKQRLEASFTYDIKIPFNQIKSREAYYELHSFLFNYEGSAPVDLSNRDLTGFELGRHDFSNFNLENANLSNVSFSNEDFTDIKNIDTIVLSETCFYECDLTGINLTATQKVEACFVNCVGVKWDIKGDQTKINESLTDKKVKFKLVEIKPGGGMTPQNVITAKSELFLGFCLDLYFKNEVHILIHNQSDHQINNLVLIPQTHNLGLSAHLKSLDKLNKECQLSPNRKETRFFCSIRNNDDHFLGFGYKFSIQATWLDYKNRRCKQRFDMFFSERFDMRFGG